jgi:hypothetical protein
VINGDHPSGMGRSSVRALTSLLRPGTIAGGKPTRTAGAQGVEERKRRGSIPPCLRRPVRLRHPQSRQRDDEAVTVTTKLAETCAS